MGLASKGGATRSAGRPSNMEPRLSFESFESLGANTEEAAESGLTPKVDAALEKTKLLFEELAGLNLEEMRSRSKVSQAQDVSTPRSCEEPTGVRLALKCTGE